MNTINALRHTARWAGVVALVTTLLTGTATAATAAPASPAVADGLKPGDTFAYPNYILQLDGTSVEALKEVTVSGEQTLTIVRGPNYLSHAVTRWVDDAIAGREGRLKTATILCIDYGGNVARRFTFVGAFVTRIDYTPGGMESLTVRYFYDY
ncbi:hypothetical protein OG259_41100 [Streptomyces sp. NBC_00250]|uniref:hypothetical protein n=1 Tax=Streptomyces sp. NBC_00250 TaxID=2903641 RepID=UPI002E2A7D90|nr:hypothetical protein [Streptomyces sp. NBC_00250]